MKRLIATVLTLILIALASFTGCVSERNRDIAHDNAIEYIESKYGFTPIVLDVEIISSGSPIPSRPNTAIVTCSYEDKEFKVIASCATSSTTCTDSYQWDEFNEYFTKAIENMLDAESIEVATTLAYLDMSVKSVDDLVNSRYMTQLSIFTYGLNLESARDLDLSFLGNNYRVTIRDYLEPDAERFESSHMTTIFDQEKITLNCSAIITQDERTICEYETMEIDGMYVVYDKNANVTIETIDSDFSFVNENLDRYTYQYPYSALTVHSDIETKVIFFIPPNDIPSNCSRFVYDTHNAELSQRVVSYDIIYGDYIDYKYCPVTVNGDNTLGVAMRCW